jgi:hypothetical protein
VAALTLVRLFFVFGGVWAQEPWDRSVLPARMIGPPDVEAVRVGIERRISHGGQGRERQDAIARNDVVANLDVLASEPGNRSDRRLITQRFGTGTE